MNECKVSRAREKEGFILVQGELDRVLQGRQELAISMNTVGSRSLVYYSDYKENLEWGWGAHSRGLMSVLAMLSEDPWDVEGWWIDSLVELGRGRF